MVVVGGYDVTQSDPFPIFGTATAVDLPDQVTYVQNGSVNPNHPWYTLGTAGSALGNIAEHAAVYDSQNDRIIAFGGVLNRVDNIANFRSNDVWALHFRGPDAITNLDLSCLGQTGLILSFTAPVSPYGAAVEYDVRYSPSPITQENFASATQVATEPLPEAPGTPQTVGIGGLTKCKWYWFAMRTRDEHGNWSAISNVYTVRTKCSGGGSCPLAESVVEPTTTSLSRAFPNPARQVTRFTLTFSRADEGAEYSLAIFDVAGRRVKEIGGGAAPLGEISVGWDLRGDGGHAIEPGLYYARLEIGTRRMTQPVLVTP